MEQDFIKLTRSCLALCVMAGMAFTANAQNDSVQDLLTGKFSGVQVLSDDGAPGSAFSVRIRGLRSLRGDTQPLYVLDGVILNSPMVDADKTFWSDSQDYQALQSTLDNINPADIESIQILKDAAATAIYGSMGGNGVVVITTKHGKTGSPVAQWTSSVMLNEEMGLSNRHHASVSGGERQSTYYLSAGYSSLAGTVDGSSLNNATVNAKYDQGFKNDGKFGFALGFGLRDNAMVMATSPLGSTSTIKSDWSVSPLPGESVQTWLDNYDDNSRQYSVSPHFYLDAGLGSGFRIKGNAGFDFRNKTRYRWVGSALERASEVKGQAGQSNANSVRFNADASLVYGIHSEGHNLDASVGGGYYGTMFNEYIYEGQTFFSQDLRAPGISIAEKVSPYRHVANNNLTSSVFATIEYNYRNRYYIGASARMDRLYKFENSLGEGKIYPAVHAAWDIAKEPVMSSQNFLSTMKVSLGIGKTGTQDVRPMGYTGFYTFGGDLELDQSILQNYYDMRWYNVTKEKTLGLDIGLVNDRLNLSVEAYDMRSDDAMEYYYHELKGAYTLSAYSNAAVTNRGVEVSFNGLIIDSRNFSWKIGANFSYNENKVADTGTVGDHFGSSIGVLNGNDLVVNVNRVGESVGSFYGYKSQGAVEKEHTLLTPAYMGQRQEIGDVKFIDINGDGDVTAEDQTVIGHPLPKYLAGFTSTMTFKNFTLEADFDGAFDFDVANIQKFYSDSEFDLGSSRGVEVFSSRLVEDASYVRLANIALSYDYSLKNIKWLDSVRFTLAGKNLLTATHYSGAAPYVNSYGFDISRLGVDNGAYPSYRSFLLGVTLRF